MAYIASAIMGLFLAASLLLWEARPQVAVEEQAVVAPATDIEAIVFNAADQFGVPRSLAKAVLTQESGGDPGSTSSVGAAGLMQVMPGTAAGIASELGYTTYDLYDPQTNATFGMYYLSEKLQRYGVPWGLAAYNWGPAAVDSFLTRHPGVDWSAAVASYGAEIPAETRGYVTNILAMAGQLEETQRAVEPVSLPQAYVTSQPYLLQGDIGTNVRAALNANDGALLAFEIGPGETWSFGRSIKPISALGYLPVVCGPAGCNPGGGWCDLSALYVKVADQLGMESHFPAHVGVSDPRFPGILLNDGDDSGDLTIYNPTSSPVRFRAFEQDGLLIVEGGF